MQKLINVLALSSFVVSGAVVGGGYYVFANKEVIIENVKSQVLAQVTGGIIPELPTDLPIDLPISGEVSGDVSTPVPIPSVPSF